ncbi:hypothetical protein ABPG75_003077 [Micractinium tetrahymenae]
MKGSRQPISDITRSAHPKETRSPPRALAPSGRLAQTIGLQPHSHDPGLPQTHYPTLHCSAQPSMTAKPIALLALCCLLCGAAMAARPDEAYEIEGKGVVPKSYVPDDRSVQLPTQFKPAGSGEATPLDTQSRAARSYGTVKVKVYCYGSRGCYFSYRYVDGSENLHSGTASLKKGYYFWFKQNKGYYYEIKGYKYDPARSKSLRFC